MRLIHASNAPNIAVGVDEEDFDWLNSLTWTYAPHGKAFTRKYLDDEGTRHSTTLHASIIENQGILMPPNHVIIRKDFDPFNNVRSNLAIVPFRVMLWRKKGKKGSSEYRGVHRSSRSWMAQIKPPGTDKIQVLGRFGTQIEAAEAWDNAAFELLPKVYLQYTWLNLPKSNERRAKLFDHN